MLEYACGLGSPVVFFEPKRLYWKRRRQPPRTGPRGLRAGCPHDPQRIRHHRRRVQEVLEDMLAAAHALAGTIDVEVLDLRWIAPMDFDSVLASVARTGRLLVVHEAVELCGRGAELVATVAEHGSHILTTPMRRLAPDTRCPPSADAENDYLIGQSDIVGAIEEMCR